MGLSELAAGLEVTESQDEHGVATVDTTEADLADRLEPFAGRLPCTPAEAEAVLERYAAGASVGVAAHTADVAPMTAAKTLHLLGESVSPLGPTGRGVVRDWLAGDLSRTEALELTRVGETEFALATYVETHEPIEAACAAVEGVLAADRLTGESPLADATGDATEFL
jgi:hypothetical protein